MAVAYRSSSRTGQSDAYVSSINVPVPTGAAAGDIALVSVSRWESTNPAITAPSGFTEITQVVSGPDKIAIYWKRLTGADSGNYTFSWSGSQWALGQAMLATGVVASGDPIDAYHGVAASGAAYPATSVVATDADFLALFVRNATSGAGSPPASFTEVQDADYIKTNYRIPGAAGTYSGSGGTLPSGMCLGVLVAIKPAGGGASTVNGTASGSLGGLTATTSGHRNRTGTASAPLGGLTATTTGKRTTRGTAAAQLGSLSGAATAVTSRLVTWSGHTWAVRPDFGQPGPNYWGTTTGSVALDGTDLVLKIANLSGTWTSAEVDRIGANLGYGRYRWTYTIDVEHLDYKPVLGLYVYDQDPGSAPSQREIDIEVTKWNYAPETSTMWYSVHPTADGEHRESDHVQSFAAPYTAEFVWQSGQVYFRTVDANGVLLGEHVVTQGVQAPGTEQPSMNLWLIDGDPPTDGLPVTATIHSFAFDAGVTHSLVAADTQTDDFATPWKFAVKDGASITGGELVLPCTSGYTSAYTGSTFDLRNSYTQIEISGIPTPAGNYSQETLWYLRHDADNYLMMFVSGGSFVGRRRQGGVNSDTGLGVHDPVTHRFWRIALSGTTVSYQASADGSSWSTLGTATTTLTSQQLSTLRHRFECGHWASETAPAPLTVTTLGVQTTKVGTAAAGLGGLAASAAGHRVQTGAAAATLGGLSSSAAGHRNRSGTAAASLGALGSSASGVRSVVASASAPLGVLAGAAGGHRNLTGTAAAALGGLTGAAAGVRTVFGSAAAGLGGLASSASGHRNRSGTASAPLGLLVASATGLHSVLGSGAAPLGALAAAAAGVRTRPGVAVASLGGLASSATGTRKTAGVATASLGALVGSASSTPRGTAAGSLGALTGSATGVVRVPGVAVAGLGGLQALSTSTVRRSGTAAAGLGPLSGQVSGRVTVYGSGAAPLGRLVGSATSATVGGAQANLGGLTAAATGRRAVRGVASSQLGVLAASAAGMIVAYGTAAAQFGGLTASAVGHGIPRAGAAAPLGSLLATAVGARVVAAAAVALLGQLRAAAVVDELQGPVHAGTPIGPSTHAGSPISSRLGAGPPSGRVVHAGAPAQTR